MQQYPGKFSADPEYRFEEELKDDLKNQLEHVGPQHCVKRRSRAPRAV